MKNGCDRSKKRSPAGVGSPRQQERKRRSTQMFTRRQALLGAMGAATGAALVAAMPRLAVASEAELAGLPREKVTLVAPPFVHPHDQVAEGGPKVVEFTMTIQEKTVVVDDEGTTLQAMTYNGS